MVEAQKGNAKAYNQLLVELSAYLINYLKFKTRSEATAYDMLQEVLLSVHSSRHTYRSEFPFKPWLFKIVQSRLIDYFRKMKNKIEISTIESDFNSDQCLAEAEVSFLQVKDFNQALGSLSKDQRDILVALKIDGKSIKEIATTKNMSESAVKTSAHRAIKQVLSFYEESV
jgi:RNA polymerase sigma-70 factor, ECF subfamily